VCQSCNQLHLALEAPPRPVVACQRTNQRPHLDGKFEEAFWRDAVPIALKPAIGAVGTVVFLAGPAAASSAFTSPSDGQTLSSAPTVSGSVSMSQPITALALAADDGHGHGDTITLHCGDPGASCDSAGTTMTFSWTPNLAYNGNYTLTGRADGQATLVSQAATESLGPLHFGVAVAPIAPRNVSASVAPSRVATVSWRPNPEPDVTTYLVYRSIDGGDMRAVGSVSGASKTFSYQDAASTQAGGRYAYQVVAVRPDADGNPSTGVASSPSAPARATVPAPPPGATGTTSGSSGAAGGSSGSTSGGRTASSSSGPVLAVPRAGRIDLSNFRALESAATTPGTPAPADTGYKSTLPYQTDDSTTTAPASTTAGRGSEASSAALDLGEGDTSHRQALLGFVAGAMILFMVSMHMRWLLRRTSSDLAQDRR